MKSNQNGSDAETPQSGRSSEEWGSPEDNPGELDMKRSAGYGSPSQIRMPLPSSKRHKMLPPKPAQPEEATRPEHVNLFGEDDLGELPVFESLHPQEKTTTPSRRPESEPAPDVIDMGNRAHLQPKPRPQESVSFEALNRELRLDAFQQFQKMTASDYLVTASTPIMIFLMVASVVYFLLDVRYVFDARNINNLRWTAFFFIMGIVALNRLVARDGRDESILYIVGLFIVVILYSLGMEGLGSAQLSQRFLGGWGETVLNLVIVMFIWWLVNRLTHECCVDTHPEAGDVGMLTATARSLRERLASKPKEANPYEGWNSAMVDPYEAIDPSEWKPPEKKAPEPPAEANQRLRRRHPGVSVFYFSLPVLLVFAIGQRVTQHCPPIMQMAQDAYVACYAFAALNLLMLTSLFQLREYFRTRRISLPPGLAMFWLSLGFVMTLLVLCAAFALPSPPMPPIAHVPEQIQDPWNPSAGFALTPVVTNKVEQLQQSRLIEWISLASLIILALFIAYAALRGLGSIAFAIARQRNRYPQWVIRFFNWLDRLLIRLASLPKLPSFQFQPRISRDVALSAQYRNPLADDPQADRRMGQAALIGYAYEALCALAQDLGHPRRLDQTPYEFMHDFPRELSSLRNCAEELTELYVQSNYAGVIFTDDVLDRLRLFWSYYSVARNRVLR